MKINWYNWLEMLQFLPLTRYKPGILFHLLSENYRDLIEHYHLPHEEQLIDNWKKFDKEAFGNTQVGKCVFITSLDGKPIGFASYDPRLGQEYGIIGHNCILAEYRGKGYGREQIEELLRIFRKLHFRKVKVKTGDHSFFIPAQRLYLSLGFKETKRSKNGVQDFPVIEYEMYL